MENKWKLFVLDSCFWFFFFPYKGRFVMATQFEINWDLKMNSKIYHQFPVIFLISQLVFLYKNENKWRTNGHLLPKAFVCFFPLLRKLCSFFVLFVLFWTVIQFAKIAKFEIKKIKIELKSLHFHQVCFFYISCTALQYTVIVYQLFLFIFLLRHLRRNIWEIWDFHQCWNFTKT